MKERRHILRKSFNPWVIFGVALLAPPLVCWLAIILGILGLERAWELLDKLSSTQEFLLMVISPLVAALMGLWSIRRLRRNDESNAALCRATILAGTLFAVIAVLASLRSS